MIRAADHSLYIGITTDMERRFQEHCAQGKKCAKYLRGRSPLTLVWSQQVGGHGEALRLERRLKRLPKRKKEQIIQGEISWDSLHNSGPVQRMS